MAEILDSQVLDCLLYHPEMFLSQVSVLIFITYSNYFGITFSAVYQMHKLLNVLRLLLWLKPKSLVNFQGSMYTHFFKSSIFMDDCVKNTNCFDSHIYPCTFLLLEDIGKVLFLGETVGNKYLLNYETQDIFNRHIMIGHVYP